MPTTIEFWECDGVSLSEQGWNVSTLSGRYNVPQLRGEDATYAYVEGQDFRPKIPDSRQITLQMWVQGVEPGTGIAGPDQMRRWNDNWHFLCQLFWTPKRQVVLTRRWLRTNDNGTVEIQVTTAKAQYIGGLEPSMTGRFRSTFQVDFKLHDPFFYPQVDTTATVANAGTAATPSELVTVRNPGDYIAAGRHMFVEFHGPLTNPVLQNATPAPDVAVGYTGSLASGQVLTLDIRNFTAKLNQQDTGVPGSNLNRTGFVGHSGSRYWFGLERGDNLLALTSSGDTSGYAVVKYRPPYL